MCFCDRDPGTPAWQSVSAWTSCLLPRPPLSRRTLLTTLCSSPAKVRLPTSSAHHKSQPRSPPLPPPPPQGPSSQLGRLWAGAGQGFCPAGTAVGGGAGGRGGGGNAGTLGKCPLLNFSQVFCRDQSEASVPRPEAPLTSSASQKVLVLFGVVLIQPNQSGDLK